LGPVTSIPDRKSADAVAGEHDEGGIGFTKEQQWKVDFATAEVTKRPLRPRSPPPARCAADPTAKPC
jgi:hypothetical protein